MNAEKITYKIVPVGTRSLKLKRHTVTVPTGSGNGRMDAYLHLIADATGTALDEILICSIRPV